MRIRALPFAPLIARAVNVRYWKSPAVRNAGSPVALTTGPVALTTGPVALTTGGINKPKPTRIEVRLVPPASLLSSKDSN